MRRNMILVFSLLVLTAQAHAAARPAFNLFGISHHGDREAVETWDLNEANLGFGLQYDLRVGRRHRIFLEAGALNDSFRHTSVHLGVTWRHRLKGPLHGGLGLYALKSASYEGGLPIYVPLPHLSLEAGPADLTMTYLPPVDSVNFYETLLFSATLHPFGRTPEGHGVPTPDPVIRHGVEFGVNPAYGLERSGETTVAWRRFEPGGAGYRLGMDLSVDVIDRDRLPWEDHESSRFELKVFGERLSTVSDGRDLDLVASFGFLIGAYSASYSDLISWKAGALGGLAAEWPLQRSVTLMLESKMGLTLDYEGRMRESLDYETDEIVMVKSVSRHWTLTTTDLRLGLLLYFD